MAYSTVRVPCIVTLTHGLGVAAMSIRWKGEQSGDEKKAEPSEGRPTETRHRFGKETRP